MRYQGCSSRVIPLKCTEVREHVIHKTFRILLYSKIKGFLEKLLSEVGKLQNTRVITCEELHLLIEINTPRLF